MDDKNKITIKDSFSELGAIQKAFTPEQVKFVIEAVAPGLNEKEVWLFLLKANVLKLNPLLGEIFAYVSVDGYGKRRLVVIEGRNGKRNLAGKSGSIESIKTEAIYTKTITDKENGEMTIKVEPWDGKLWGARCEIKIKGKEALIVESVKLSEYDTKKSVWASKPETMIKKVAESQALSAALPGIMLDLLGEGENFINGEAKVVPTIEGGDKPATEAMMRTLTTMGADMNRTYTIQEANEEIIRITREKNSKKKA